MTTTRPVDPRPEEGAASLSPAEHRVLEAAGDLAQAGTTLRHRLDEAPPGEDPAWSTYVALVESSIATLQVDLVLAGARLRADRASDTAQVGDAVTEASDLAHQTIDTLRVRAHLGRMELASGTEAAVAELDHLAADLRDTTRRVEHAATASFDEVRRGASTAIRDVIAVLRAAAATVHPDDLPPPSSPPSSPPSEAGT